MIKRLFLTVLIISALIAMPAYVFATAGVTASNAGTNFNEYGTSVLITAEASATTAAFATILFSVDTNSVIYQSILAKWITSARTTIPSAIAAPTANYDIYILDGVNATSDFVLASPALAIGSTTTNVYTGTFNFVINGVSYATTEVAAGTAPGNDVIPQNKYGAVALDIGANDTIDAIEASGNAAGTYTTAALAIAGVAAAGSDHVRLGYVTASKSDGTFTFGAGGTALNAANTTVAYTSTIPAFDIMGGRLTNRSATVTQDVFPANTADDNKYEFIRRSLMIIFVNNSVNSAVITLELIFN